MCKTRLLLPLTMSIVLLAACGKKPDTATITQPVPPTTPAPATPASPPPAAAEEDSEMAKRKAAVEFALAEQKIAEDPQGQWATTATASSTYNGAKEQAHYSEWQATGAPNVEHYGDTGEAWAPKDADAGIEWLQLGFAKPVHATAIRIRQNNAPGAIIKIELIDDTNAKHTVFEGIDANKYPANSIVWFVQTVDKTPYAVTGAKITLATNAVQGWNEIDAVQLVGE